MVMMVRQVPLAQTAPMAQTARMVPMVPIRRLLRRGGGGFQLVQILLDLHLPQAGDGPSEPLDVGGLRTRAPHGL